MLLAQTLDGRTVIANYYLRFGQPMNNLTILCVDDETIVLESLVEQLKRNLGNTYEVEAAESGEEALEILEELQEEGIEVAAIVSDQIMPGIKGDELLIQIHSRYPKSLKIMLTGQADARSVGNAVNAAKLYRYISKPWEETDLILTVKEAINSYIQDKELAEKTEKLEKINQELDTLSNDQAQLIEQLFKVNCDLEMSLERQVQLTEATERFVPRQFINFLGKESIVDVKLGDCVQQEMSVLFSDIRSFTTLSEKMTPEESFKFINSYLYRMEPIIINHHGFIDKYIGDGIMALFSQSADDAVKAGIFMLQSLAEYNQERSQLGEQPIEIGIGINTGCVMLGAVGGYSQMDSTAISDTVNLASRLEHLTKHYRVSLLISHHTFLELENTADYAVRPIAKLQVKGKSEWVSVYEVFEGDRPEIKASKLAMATTFTEALLFYYNLKDYREAARRFELCWQKTPEDTVAQVYLHACQEMISEQEKYPKCLSINEMIDTGFVG